MFDDLFIPSIADIDDSPIVLDDSIDALDANVDDSTLNDAPVVDALGVVNSTSFVENIDLVSKVENFVSDFDTSFTISGWYKDFISRFSPDFSDQDVVRSVKEASDFFHIDEPITIQEGSGTGVFLNDSITPLDDVLVFSKSQLQEIGITGKDSLDLVMPHEGAHRMLQGRQIGFNSHQEELCCDYMAGVRAGLNNIDLSPLENAFSDMDVSVTHPIGSDRVIALDRGRAFAISYMNEHGEPPSFDECLDDFTDNTSDGESSIGIHKEFENGEPLSNSNIAFKGFSDDKAYHLRKAQEAKEWAEWHEKRVEEATRKDDISSAKDHADRAASYRRKQKEELEIANKCTK